MIFNLTQPLISSVPVLGKDFTWSGSDGTCLVIDDGGGNWRILQNLHGIARNTTVGYPEAGKILM